tara:strand:- start:5 stop:598 length:594 start_codon:yes stop_codon:yes gene_type:complete
MTLKEQMDLLGWKDITTDRQIKNGTRIYRLPIKMYGQYIEVGSFKSGYVRRMNGGYTPYQLNKCEPSVEYYKDYKTIWNKDRSDYTQKFTGKYNKFVGKRRIKIDTKEERLEHLIAYCLKNYYIKQANQVEDGKFIPKWKHEWELEKASKFKWSGGQITTDTGEIYIHEQHAYWNKWKEDKPSSVEIIIDGHRYKVK